MQIAPDPVFRLYLMRHARAGWALPGQTDFDRTLEDTGFAEAEIVADTAADRRLVPDLVLSSTAVRCRQTAEAFRRAMKEDLEIRFVDSLYAGTATVYADLVRANSALSSIMLVGHNPVIEEILFDILGAHATAEIIPTGFPPGALAVIDFAAPPADDLAERGVLAAWITPDARKS